MRPHDGYHAIEDIHWGLRSGGDVNFKVGAELGRAASEADPGTGVQPDFRKAWRIASELGIVQALMSAEGFDADVAFDMLEGAGTTCKSRGFLLGLVAHCFGVGAPLAQFGAREHFETIERLRCGELIGALAVTEPEAGSDVMALRTVFSETPDGYSLSGRKCYVTNIRDADVFLVLATKDPRLHYRGLAAFLVPAGSHGVTVDSDLDRACLRGCTIGSLVLDAVEIPRSAMVGRAGMGAKIFRHAMLWERTLVTVPLLGNIRREFLTSLEHAKKRCQYGRSIGQNQYVSGRLVDIFRAYYTSRLVARDAIIKLANGCLSDGQASLTKLHVTEAAVSASGDAFRVLGGAAIFEAGLIEDLDDAYCSLIYSGTSEIQKVIIASEFGLHT